MGRVGPCGRCRGANFCRHECGELIPLAASTPFHSPRHHLRPGTGAAEVAKGVLRRRAEGKRIASARPIACPGHRTTRRRGSGRPRPARLAAAAQFQYAESKLASHVSVVALPLPRGGIIPGPP